MLENRNLNVYNSLTNKLEKFIPIEEGKVTMYVCGPTVYNYIHIGNARPAVFFDVMYRYFKMVGYDVKYISNFTDIDDKIINRAIEEGVSELEVTQKYIAAYNEDIVAMNCLSVDIRCKVTDYMNHITEFIDQLLDDGYAYRVDGDVYFDVTKLDKYGVLSNNNIEELNAGERISVNDSKKHPADFTLWKKTDKGITFESSSGDGRPGWHTECVVMIKSLTDGKVDIHGGGQDLCFPHHENEIAQSVAYDSTSLANYWIHNGMLNLNDDKMSKSLGNVLLVKEFLSKYSSNVLRLALLQTHYRSTINFNDDLIESTIKLDDKFSNVFKKMELEKQLGNGDVCDASGKYFEFLEDDFNTSNLITYMLDITKSINNAIRNKENVLEFYNEFMNVVYLLGLKYEYPVLSDEDKNSYYEWMNARDNKDFETADKLRAELESKGVI